MKFIVEAGTDGGSVVLFDPEALPQPLPSHEVDSEAAEKEFFTLIDDELVLWLSLGGDGDYWLHVYLDEPVPSVLEAFADEEQTYTHFPVPTGNLRFIGAEHIFDFDGHKHMGSTFQIAPGIYSVRVFEAVYPRNFHLRELRKRVALIPYLLYRLASAFLMFALFSCCGTLGALVHSLRNPNAIYAAAILFGLVIIAVGLFALPRRTQREADELREEYPHFVAHFTRVETSVP